MLRTIACGRAAANRVASAQSRRSIIQNSSSVSSPRSSASIQWYSTSKPLSKYYTIGGEDMSEEEIKAMFEEEIKKIEEEKIAKEYRDWKPGQRKRPLRMAYTLEEFEEEFTGIPRKWNTRDKRCGALGIKVGMMPVWDEWGERHPCTVLFLDNNFVLDHKTEERDGYRAVQVAAGARKRKNVTRPLLGHFLKCGWEGEDPPVIVREFRVTTDMPPIGSPIHARHFVPGQAIDVAGISKGKGFQGAMKRHNFGGMPASHGTSLSHRALGSVGQCQDPGKVFKGKKMAGRMGTDRVTVQNLRIIKIDRGRNLLYVKGAVPGNKGEFVEIRDAVKRPLFATKKVENEVAFPPLPTFEYEDIDGCGTAHEVMFPVPKQDPFTIDEPGEIIAE